MKNALEILQFISYSTNAEVSKASSWGNVKKDALNGLNRALRLLWNVNEWNFRRDVKRATLMPAKSSLSLGGSVLAQHGVRLQNKPLTYDEAIPFYEPETGNPTSYYVTSKDRLVVYPTPENKCSVVLELYTPYSVVGADGALKQEITEETDVLNIPETLELLFVDCLSYLCNEVLNGDPTDEDYKESQLRHSEVYRLLQNADIAKDYDNSKGFKMPWQI